MKIKKENIVIPEGRSFKVFSPSLRNYFFWHYHPEIELVFVEAISGIRHVGKNISGYVGSELVLIGPNIPHLNFDYGIQTEYRQIVVQLKEEFLQDMIIPTIEFASIRHLLERAYLGLSFKGRTKEAVVERLRRIKELDAFDSLLELIGILRILAGSTEVEYLNEEDTAVKWFLNDKIRMGTIYDYINKNYDKNPDVNTVARTVNLSTPAFCRYFKKQTDMTFTDFVNQYRITQAKTMLLQGETASTVCYNVGFDSVSYFNKLFKKLTHETPSSFRRRYSASGSEPKE
jgi:AraC-like DNA-binding protein